MQILLSSTPVVPGRWHYTGCIQQHDQRKQLSYWVMEPAVGQGTQESAWKSLRPQAPEKSPGQAQRQCTGRALLSTSELSPYHFIGLPVFIIRVRPKLQVSIFDEGDM